MMRWFGIALLLGLAWYAFRSNYDEQLKKDSKGAMIVVVLLIGIEEIARLNERRERRG